MTPAGERFLPEIAWPASPTSGPGTSKAGGNADAVGPAVTRAARADIRAPLARCGRRHQEPAGALRSRPRKNKRLRAAGPPTDRPRRLVLPATRATAPQL